MKLSDEAARVIGALIEKQLTTPQQYPLTLNALIAACNQSSNRDPVVDYDENTVQRTVRTLKDEGLVHFVYPSHGRSVIRYRHALDEMLKLEDTHLALFAVLLLRGAQTAGELRLRTERIAGYENAGVEEVLSQMQDRPEPLVLRLARRPGQKEERWVDAVTSHPDAAGAETLPAVAAGQARQDLRTDVEALRSEVADLRAEIAALRSQLEG